MFESVKQVGEPVEFLTIKGIVRKFYFLMVLNLLGLLVMFVGTVLLHLKIEAGYYPFVLLIPSGLFLLFKTKVDTKPLLAKRVAGLYSLLEGVIVGMAIAASGTSNLVSVAVFLAFIFQPLFYKTKSISPKTLSKWVALLTLSLGVASLILFAIISLQHLNSISHDFIFGSKVITIGFSVLCIFVGQTLFWVENSFLEDVSEAQLPKDLEWYYAMGIPSLSMIKELNKKSKEKTTLTKE
jgi:hypothetical protein